LKDYATISVPREIKEELNEMRRGREWGDFLLAMSRETKELKSGRALAKLATVLSDEDLDAIEKSSREFREGFSLRCISLTPASSSRT
jgi:predicted CopG family antitoxin